MDVCKDALLALSRHLHAAHGEPVVILLDEYDTPLHEAFRHGYYDKAVAFLRSLLSGCLKDNPHLFKGVLTGILRIAKESLFSDLNNLGVYSLVDRRYATDFGFTEPEVQDLQHRLRSPHSMEELRRWYNGYHFGGEVIYNPWSVLSALARPDDPLRSYWVNTASDELIREMLFRFGGGGETMETLLRGQGVRAALRENTVLRDVYEDPSALWSFLVFTGYLKAEDVRMEPQGEAYVQLTGTLKVPNLEVSAAFSDLFASWLRRTTTDPQALMRSLLSGDLPRFEEQLQRILLESASFHDLSGKRVTMPPENVYQVFILGLLVILSPRHRVTANREGGHGRYDVMVIPREAGQPGAVLELKVKTKEGTLQSAVTAAKKQLRAKDYAAELRAHGASPIQQVAVAFDGKRVLVADASEPTRRRRPARGRSRA